MPLLTAAVGFLSLLVLIDLVLTVGIVKRLREHTGRLSDLERAGGRLEIGQEVGGFEARCTDGETVHSGRVVDDTLVAFFSPSCSSCHEKLPEFVDYAAKAPHGREQVLAVIVGGAEEASPFVSALRPVARVVVEPAGGPLSTALRTHTFPSILRLGRTPDGRVVVTNSQSAVLATAGAHA